MLAAFLLPVLVGPFLCVMDGLDAGMLDPPSRDPGDDPGSAKAHRTGAPYRGDGADIDRLGLGRLSEGCGSWTHR
jgi:hypothetical protein